MDHSGSGTPPLIRALIADDHLVVRRGIGALLSSISGIEVVAEPSTGQDVLREAQHRTTRPWQGSDLRVAA